ncbi:hypothetical protein ES703_88256 [subsurface metagenome]
MGKKPISKSAQHGMSKKAFHGLLKKVSQPIKKSEKGKSQA